MEVRKSRIEDVEQIIQIIDQAKAYLKSKNINQWQDGYPNSDTIIKDIETNTSYVLVDSDKVIGTMRFAIEEDSDYGYIEGKWLSERPYGVIHRIAISSEFKGKDYANELLKFCVNECVLNHVYSIKIDTHEENISMQNFLKKHQFNYCGIVYIRGVDKRIAFEKNLSE